MNEEEVLKVANMTKVAVLAGIRTAIKAGKTLEQAIGAYENSSFCFKDDNLVIVFDKKRGR